MKTYEPRRNNACPNAEATGHSPFGSGQPDECTCPWLVIASTTPVQHFTSWSRRELENIIREMDQGYFDPPGYPKRSTSMFLSPAMQRLLDVAEKSPIAAALTLLAGSGSGLPPFDAITWSAIDACLSLRTAPLSWMQLWLGHTNTEAITDSAAQMPGGAEPMLLWADHADTYAEVNLRRYGAASVSVLPEVSGDVYAEGGEHLAECQRNGTCCGTCNADFGTCCPHEPSPIKTTPGQVIATAQEAADVAANSTTARIMGDYMPLILTVPADEIDNLRAGNPVFDEAMRQAQEGGHAGFVAMPEEMTFPEGADPTIVANVEAFLTDPSTGVRRERPLSRRVPQVPSDIAQAAVGEHCTCDLNLRYTCPPCRDAQADACTCAIRGSGPDTYACPEHPADV